MALCGRCTVIADQGRLDPNRSARLRPVRNTFRASLSQRLNRLKFRSALNSLAPATFQKRRAATCELELVQISNAAEKVSRRLAKPAARSAAASIPAGPAKPHRATPKA